MSGETFTLHVLPAGIGDALVLDYGAAGQQHRVVIDGGVTRTAESLAAFLGPTPDIEMLMITHVDNDHIAGVLKMLERQLSRPRLDDVWFNGFRHLPASPLESMGPVEGERLTTFLVDHNIPWNAHPAFAGRAVQTAGGERPTVATLPGGLRCTVLSPGHNELNALRPKWLPVVQEANLDPAEPAPEEELRPPGRLERLGPLDAATLAAQPSPKDNKEANGSSIAVLASWAGRTALLTGDAHAPVLLDTIDRWLGPNGTLSVDVFKLPHHGSKANITNELMARIKAKVYVFSSSGEGRSRHPDDQAVARVIMNSTGERELAFNYRTVRTEPWDDAELKEQYGYRTRYPDDPEVGLAIDLMAL